MKKTKPVKLCFDIEIEGNLLKIAYLNINGLKNKLQHITSDNWYSQFDILIFSETHTREKHNSDIHLALPQFQIAFRTDARSGLMCYTKDRICNKCKNFTLKIEESKPEEKKQYHVFLLHFTLIGINIITGYKSPSTKFEIYHSMKYMKNVLKIHQLLFWVILILIQLKMIRN